MRLKEFPSPNGALPPDSALKPYYQYIVGDPSQLYSPASTLRNPRRRHGSISPAAARSIASSNRTAAPDAPVRRSAPIQGVLEGGPVNDGQTFSRLSSNWARMVHPRQDLADVTVFGQVRRLSKSCSALGIILYISGTTATWWVIDTVDDRGATLQWRRHIYRHFQLTEKYLIWDWITATQRGAVGVRTVGGAFLF